MSKLSETHPKLNKALRFAAAAALAAAAVWATVRLLPVVLRLRDPAFRQSFRAWADGLGVWGAGVMLAIQVAQIVLAVIPGEPVELAAGVLYGGWGGLLLCEAGILIGQSIVFLLVRRFGRPLVELQFDRRKVDELKLLNDPMRLETTVFLLYLIPGTPKDILCYAAGLAPISLPRFLALSAVARIPSVISSTFAGAAVGQGDLVKSIWLFVLVGALGLGGILLRKPLMDWLERRRGPGSR